MQIREKIPKDVTKMETLKVKEWTPQNGSKRYYVNNWKELCGVRIQKHSSGNVSSATFFGNETSNRSATRYLVNAKVWYGEDKKIIVDYSDEMFVRDIVEKIQPMVDAGAVEYI